MTTLLVITPHNEVSTSRGKKIITTGFDVRKFEDRKLVDRALVGIDKDTDPQELKLMLEEFRTTTAEETAA